MLSKCRAAACVNTADGCVNSADMSMRRADLFTLKNTRQLFCYFGIVILYLYMKRDQPSLNPISTYKSMLVQLT